MKKLRLDIMKLCWKKSVLVLVIIFALNISVANDYFYVVKKGDTLSSILAAKKLRPLYGEKGTIAATVKLNPNLGATKGNKIFPKMKILLAKTTPVIKADPIASVDDASSTKVKEPEKIVNERVPSDDFKQSFYWNVSPTLSWKNLSSTDDNINRSSQINVLSNTSYGMSLLYGMHFEESVDIYSRLFLESVSFEQNNSINLLKKKFLASSFGVGLLYKKKWQMELAMSDEYFLTSPSASTIDIKKVALPEIKTSYIDDFYRYRNADLSYLLSGSAFLPRSSADVNSKLSYRAGAAIQAKLHNQSFQIGYDLNLLKASGNSTNYQNIYWKYTWENQ